MAFCKYCGVPLGEAAISFCPNCGKPIAANINEATAQTAGVVDTANAAAAQISGVVDTANAAAAQTSGDYIQTANAYAARSAGVVDTANAAAARSAGVVDTANAYAAQEEYRPYNASREIPPQGPSYQQPAYQQPAYQQATTQQPRKKKVGLIIGIAVVVLLLFWGILAAIIVPPILKAFKTDSIDNWLGEFNGTVTVKGYGSDYDYVDGTYNCYAIIGGSDGKEFLEFYSSDMDVYNNIDFSYGESPIASMYVKLEDGKLVPVIDDDAFVIDEALTSEKASAFVLTNTSYLHIEYTYEDPEFDGGMVIVFDVKK